MNFFSQYSVLNSFLNKNKTIGLVPTMGALHEGHISLIERATIENEQVIVTIFVNPTQFENPEEIKSYPQNLNLDIQMIKKASPKSMIYAPKSNDLYDSKMKTYSYEFGILEKIMEGKFRNGHFQGVATIVEKLLNNFSPTKAYFGEKDFQQLLIIKSLVDQKKIPTSIVGCTTYRDSQGLALSSRNKLLNTKELKNAIFLIEQLKLAKSLWKRENSLRITKIIEENFLNNTWLKLDYFDIRFENNLLKAKEKSDQKTRAFIAARIGKTRLIDNLLLNEY